MEYIARTVEKRLADILARGRSALPLGARQTGKTTLAQQLNPDVQPNFIRPEVRQRYEQRPELLGAEIESRPIPPKRKWSDAPTAKDTRHLETFLREHRNVHRGLVICRTPRRFQLAHGIVALPWQDIPSVIEEFLG